MSVVIPLKNNPKYLHQDIDNMPFRIVADKPSTIIKLNDSNNVEVLREGAITTDDFRKTYSL